MITKTFFARSLLGLVAATLVACGAPVDDEGANEAREDGLLMSPSPTPKPTATPIPVPIDPDGWGYNRDDDTQCVTTSWAWGSLGALSWEEPAAQERDSVHALGGTRGDAARDLCNWLKDFWKKHPKPRRYIPPDGRLPTSMPPGTIAGQPNDARWRGWLEMPDGSVTVVDFDKRGHGWPPHGHGPGDSVPDIHKHRPEDAVPLDTMCPDGKKNLQKMGDPSQDAPVVIPPALPPPPVPQPPPPGGCDINPSAMACHADGTPTSPTEIHNGCIDALKNNKDLTVDGKNACYQKCKTNTENAQKNCKGGGN